MGLCGHLGCHGETVELLSDDLVAFGSSVENRHSVSEVFAQLLLRPGWRGRRSGAPARNPPVAPSYPISRPFARTLAAQVERHKCPSKERFDEPTQPVLGSGFR